ncbi:MAG: PaaI family thioesterase [Flaviflexus sp.]|nr:PaaI family thioesterase [Flaviflexus sp.]
MGPLAARMGFELRSLTTTSASGYLPVEGNTQPMGIMHGGANGFLVEHLASVLANHVCPENMVAVGTELQVSHIAPARSAVEATATVAAQRGRSIWLDVEITCQGELTARGRLTCRFLAAPPA